jgi:hypothetical protein
VSKYRTDEHGSAPIIDIPSNPIHRRVGPSALKFDETCYHREFAVVRCDIPKRSVDVVAEAQKIAKQTVEALKVKADMKTEYDASAKFRYRGAMGEIVMEKVVSISNSAQEGACQ